MTDLQKVPVFLAFAEKQGGAIPVSLAAVMLKITAQGVNSAIQRRKIASIKWRGHYYVGLKSVKAYRWFNSTKFKDNAAYKFEYLRDLDEEGSP